MTIEDFKLRRNRQAPEICYSYVKDDVDKKYTIFTMNSGKSFLASIEEKRLDNRFYSKFSETHESIEACLSAFVGK